MTQPAVLCLDTGLRIENCRFDIISRHPLLTTTKRRQQRFMREDIEQARNAIGITVQQPHTGRRKNHPSLIAGHVHAMIEVKPQFRPLQALKVIFKPDTLP